MNKSLAKEIRIVNKINKELVRYNKLLKQRVDDYENEINMYKAAIKELQDEIVVLKCPFDPEAMRQGKEGENAVTEHYEKLGYKVIDVSMEKEYQEKDIDMLLYDEQDDYVASVEVKNCNKAKETGKVFVQTMKNVEMDVIGWIFDCEADYLVFKSQDTMWTTYTRQMRDYVRKCMQKEPGFTSTARMMPGNHKHFGLYHTETFLVDLEGEYKDLGYYVERELI